MGSLSQTLDLEQFVTARLRSQVLSTQVDVQCDQLTTVALSECPPMCITRWDGREAARRAGLSASAETCCVVMMMMMMMIVVDWW